MYQTTKARILRRMQHIEIFPKSSTNGGLLTCETSNVQ